MSICEGYTANKRVPVYRTPSASEPPIFFVPKNYYVCISGAYGGWGIFGEIRAFGHFQAFWEMVPDQNVDYGWIRLSELQPVRSAAESPCYLRRKPGGEDRLEFPNIKNENGTNLCPTAFETVDDINAVVLFWQRHYVGETYLTLAPSSLNKCVKTCRDEAACKGLFYTISANRCDLKSGGGINFEVPGEFNGTISGVKLID